MRQGDTRKQFYLREDTDKFSPLTVCYVPWDLIISLNAWASQITVNVNGDHW